MSAHPNAFSGLARRIKSATDPGVIDQLLDKWLDYKNHATEWDALQWGFYPDTWMEEERAEMDRRERVVGSDKAKNP